MPIKLNALLVDEGYDPAEVRLLRHQTGSSKETPYSVWRDDLPRFERFQSFQLGGDRRAYFNAPYWAAFVVPPSGTTLFVGIYSAKLLGAAAPGELDPISGAVMNPGIEIYETARVPDADQAFLIVLRDLAYSDILEIDEIGDDYCDLPTIYATFRDGQPPYAESGDAYFDMRRWGERRHPLHDRRVRLFPDWMRDPQWEARWVEGTGGALPPAPFIVQGADGTTWTGEPSAGAHS